ncbi:winged helix DNA-binding domain-containing protein [Nocardioides jiangxiensis]|uniref:Winged helix DNA-binding domain-containing protein n=1 Tax=Nocardioides jiangxiensis TaxID=3064524 RepID=A0ABT9B313_9ACTN|nr:winged helix DNA-binding domain-containing protein [Nocardioides sp. WY-20]MDO7868770.1 winged helix DNA-binding domain-containing protein [Nocardioides sp. WY-20]
MRASLAPHRLRPQRLVGAPLAGPAEVVGHLGGVQSQLHDMSLWAIGRRCGATLADVEASFAAGAFVRTHVLRPTWHHVLPADLPDLLEVTAPRVRQASASNSRRDGLTAESIARWSALAIEAIRSAGPLTRPEVEARLAEEGFERVGNAMAHVMIEAELTGEIHSGPPRGKQQTYVAASLPASRRSPDERLGWLARRYAEGHGPIAAVDLSWWAGLTLTQSRRAIGLAGLEPFGDGLFRAGPEQEVDVPAAMLLPAFDELISYARSPEDYAGVDGDVGTVLRSTGLLFVDGGLAGSWTRKVGRQATLVTVTPRRALRRAARSALEEEAERYGRFLGAPVDLVVA